LVWHDTDSENHCDDTENAIRLLAQTTGNVLQDVQQTLQTSTSDISLEQRWCNCDQIESGQMVGCDNENCKIVWFHFTCLKLTNKTNIQEMVLSRVQKTS